MVSSHKLTEKRAIGWYAVQRVRIADWFHPGSQHGQQPLESGSSHVPDEQSMSEDMTETKDDKGDKAKHERHKEADRTNDEHYDTSPDPKVEQQLQDVVNESHTVLAKATSVFPLELFPDTICIDRHKLTIIHREFFGVESTVSVPIENIKNIEADIGPFLGSITITSDLFINNTQTVRYLTRNNANMFQRLVQGAVVAQREDIDLNKIATKKLRNLLIDLGSGHSRTISG
jgi:hypothetical protein